MKVANLLITTLFIATSTEAQTAALSPVPSLVVISLAQQVADCEAAYPDEFKGRTMAFLQEALSSLDLQDIESFATQMINSNSRESSSPEKCAKTKEALSWMPAQLPCLTAHENAKFQSNEELDRLIPPYQSFYCIGARVQARELKPKRLCTEGLAISAIQPNGPAERAGLKDSETITLINGIPAAHHSILMAELAKFVPGSPLKLNVTDPLGNGRLIFLEPGSSERPLADKCDLN
jgi:hypothetical protein